jgi:U4/U6.U5 tri-snRNP-associated protein 3
MPIDAVEEDAVDMSAMMGFAGFGTTSGQHVEGNEEAGGADVKKRRKWRQYMNRQGGFNRPLDQASSSLRFAGVSLTCKTQME